MFKPKKECKYCDHFINDVCTRFCGIMTHTKPCPFFESYTIMTICKKQKEEFHKEDCFYKSLNGGKK